MTRSQTTFKPSDSFQHSYWPPLTIHNAHHTPFKGMKATAYLLIIFNKTLNVSYNVFNDLISRNTFLIPWRSLWSNC